MTFQFLGVFGTPSPTLASEFAEAWPDADIIELTTPFEAVAARLHERLHDEDADRLPANVISVVRAISTRQPGIRFFALWTFCWGGECWHSGQIVQDGNTIASFQGEYVLRSLVRFFGVDLGEREYFAPLTRDFPWTS